MRRQWWFATILLFTKRKMNGLGRFPSWLLPLFLVCDMFVDLQGGDLDEANWSLTPGVVYTLVDSELGSFTITGIGTGSTYSQSSDWQTIEEAIVAFYSSKGLPIVPNLYRAMLFLQRRYDYKIRHCVEWLKKHRDWYQQYADEIDKYVVLQ